MTIVVINRIPVLIISLFHIILEPCRDKPVQCGPEAPNTKKIILDNDYFKDYCVREDDTKTWAILDSCLDISFPQFGSEDLFNSTPDTSLNALLDFSRSPDTATLPASNTTGELVLATLPASNTTGALVPATLPASNTTGALVPATLPASNTTGELVLATLPASNTTGALVPATLPVSNTTRALVPATLPVSNTTGELVPATLPVSNTTGELVSATLPVSNTTGALVPATLPVSNTTGALVPATLPVSNTTGALVPATLPVSNTTGALVPATLPVSNTTGELVLATLPVSNTTGELVPATLPVSNTTGELVPATLPASNTTGALVPATPPACLPASNTNAALSTLAPPMREPCGQKCRRKCSEKFSEEWRKKIWAMYWNMDYTEKRAFMFCNITQLPTARLFVPKGTSRRSRSFVYRLKNEDQVPQQVCKNFFLATLGYHPTNDSLVLSVMRSDMENERIPKDQRGRHTPGNKLDLQPLLDHIESFHPSVSHYRREHAPHRRYLPSDISIKLMYADWLEKGNRCSYETYRKAVRQKNISFTKLGEEECEECLLHEQHEHACDDDVMDCLQCERWRKHKNSALQGRLAYQADAEKDWQGDTSVRSVDLQKVIMLPRMPGVKTAIFTRRIVAYHETFASVGKKGNKKHTISVVWHEGMAGRSAQEIASAYVMALEKERDVRHSIYWVDNCASQNKNWCLLSTLVCTINAATSERENITLKYFEKGHTFMSADSFHHGVELEMKRRPGGAVYDYEDFFSVVATSNSGKVEALHLKNANVLNWRDGHSTTKVKTAHKLSEMAEIQLRRGSRSLFYKLTHTDESFIELDFLQKKFSTNVPSLLRLHDRGIEERKKIEIIQKLCPLMPSSRRAFWVSLPVNMEDEE
ncbi:hypothetical protein R3I93_005136 [Phoxinus phoxinus]|uniref:Uncharacterized protein n=1 Tax=Phoxinus phoxinus TaxID=58324 RepID=A0AAN9HA82_9TELE